MRQRLEKYSILWTLAACTILAVLPAPALAQTGAIAGQVTGEGNRLVRRNAPGDAEDDAAARQRSASTPRRSGHGG